MGFIFDAVKRLIKTIIKLSLYLALIATIITFIPNLPPYTKFTSIEVSPVQPRVGPLAINSALNNAGRSYSGKLLGPEAFQIFKGELYTSLATGEIVKLSPEGHVTFVTTVGQPCSGLIHEHICGRPLGIEIDEKDESLYVADAYHGIWKVNLKTNKKQLLVSPRVEIEKRRPKLFNCIALAKNGDLYWTDSSSDFHLKDGAISFMTDPTGRLLHYDAAKNQSKVLLDDLWFANGVVLSPNNDFVLVSESSRARMMKYYISGPKKGQSEVFVDGLPGVPDNLRALPDGSGLLVALYTVFEEDRPPLTQLLAATPLVRKLVARLQRLVEIPFEYLNTIYPHIVFEEIVYFVGHFKSLSGLTPALSGVLQMDWDGNIVAGYYNTDRSLGHISDAIVFNDKLYTGSPHLQDFVGTVPVPPVLKKAFESTKKLEAPKAPKVEKNAQKVKPVQHAPIKKPEENPKAKVEEKPKVESKPKVEENPKTATKPVEKEAPKVANPAEKEVPKVAKPVQKEAPKVAKPVQKEAPKVAKPVQKEAPKEAKPVQKEAPKVAKPVVSAAPKQPQQAKPAAQQPAATKPNAPKQAPSAPSPPKPAPATEKPEPAKAPTKTEPKATVPKPEVKTTPPPKPAEKTTPPPPKKTPTETKNDAAKKAQPAVKQDAAKTAEIKPKPIKEEIPSDTAKPTKETLKVIKRDGPAEIHVAN